MDYNGNKQVMSEQSFHSTVMTSTNTGRTTKHPSSSAKDEAKRMHIADDATKIMPERLDILCGRRKDYPAHMGNRRFVALVALNFDRFNATDTRQGKSQVVQSVMYDIMSVGARFLKQNHETGIWRVITDKRFIGDKIGHALRNLSHSASRHSDMVDAKRFMKAHGGLKKCTGAGRQKEVADDCTTDQDDDDDDSVGVPPAEDDNQGFLSNRVLQKYQTANLVGAQTQASTPPSLIQLVDPNASPACHSSFSPISHVAIGASPVRPPSSFSTNYRRNPLLQEDVVNKQQVYFNGAERVPFAVNRGHLVDIGGVPYDLSEIEIGLQRQAFLLKQMFRNQFGPKEDCYLAWANSL